MKIDDTFSFQMVEYSPTVENTFQTVLEGCLKKKRLSFTYFSPAKEEMRERTVHPYHLFNYMGTWHLLGKCHLGEEIRDFALNRISGAKVLDEAYKVPDDFNFKKYFLSTFGLYKGKSIQDVTLRFSPLKAKMDQRPGVAQGSESKVPCRRISRIELSRIRLLRDQNGDIKTRRSGGSHQTKNPQRFDQS